MIHSANQNPDEIFQFAEKFRQGISEKPLIVVPSSFSQVTESELEKNGVNIVIYANQLLRSAIPSMVDAAKSILEFGSSHQLESNMMSIKDILLLFPTEDAK
jgi:phosphoenolpyruvate phosphomutase